MKDGSLFVASSYSYSSSPEAKFWSFSVRGVSSIVWSAPSVNVSLVLFFIIFFFVFVEPVALEALS